MTLIKQYTFLKKATVLLPFVLVFLGAIFLKVYHPLGSFFKMTAFLYMLFYVILYRRFPRNLLVAFVIFLPFFLYDIFISFNLSAGIEDGFRYLFPIITLMYGYAVRKHFKLIIQFIVVFLVINALVQIFQYFFWLKGEKQWFYHISKSGAWYFNQTMGVIRASGLVVYFAVFGYISMISFFIIQRYYSGRYKKFLMALSLILLFASISFKTIVSFFIVLLLLYYKKIINIIISGVIIAIVLMMAFPVQVKMFIESFLYRINSYLLMKTPTVRVESYIVMFKELFNGNLFGKGVGSFGGPASLKYHSPYYDKVNFTWPDTFWMNLTTVDTFPPHVFVELGLIGGSLFFLVLLSPLFRKRIPVIVLVIYFTLFFDMLFTFSLASLEYLMFSLVLIFPIIYYEQQLRQKTLIHEAG